VYPGLGPGRGKTKAISSGEKQGGGRRRKKEGVFVKVKKVEEWDFWRGRKGGGTMDYPLRWVGTPNLFFVFLGVNRNEIDKGKLRQGGGRLLKTKKGPIRLKSEAVGGVNLVWAGNGERIG